MASDPSPPRPRALVVDDDPVIRALAVRALEGIGFRTDQAGDGPAALEVAPRLRPDLILLDVRMPGLDGFETCQRLRRLEETRDVPIVIATALTDAPTIERAFDAGATDFVKKPIEWPLLQHRVRFLMRAQGAFHDLRRTLVNLAESEQRLASAQRLARIGHYQLDPVTGTMRWSSELHHLLGLPESDEAPPTLDTFLQLVEEGDRTAVARALRETEERGSWSLEHRVQTASGHERVVWHQAKASDAQPSDGTRVEGTIQDITEQRHSEERIRFLAYHDPLTRLPNRNHLRERLQRVLERSRRTGEGVGLVCLDLRRFHRVNDTLGHTLGDELLREVASRLVDCVRVTDLVGRPGDPAEVSRLGGDEFTIVLSRIASGEEAQQAARRILRAFDRPFRIGGHSIAMEVNLGIALSASSRDDAETMLQRADLAVSRAKQGGGGAVRFFESSMDEDAGERFQLENALRSAVELDEFYLAYQPIVHTQALSVCGVEALLRWNHPQHGMLSPARYVPVAEEMGAIHPISEWVLHEACRQLRAWLDAGLSPGRISVNVSSASFRRGNLQELVVAALEAARLPPGLLDLEITESAVLDDQENAARILARLREMGVGIVLDDFGTGYSSLSHLVQLPISGVKIDRSFVAGEVPHGSGPDVAAAVIAMARRLGLNVVAEGVETEAQERFLRREGCEELQGFRFCRPASPAVIARLLRAKGGGPTRW